MNKRFGFIFSTIFFYLIYLMQSCSVSRYIYRETSMQLVNDSTEIVESIYLIGDAGDIINYQEEPVFKEIARRSKQSRKNSIFFLGDNIYNHGLALRADSDRKRTESIINEQIRFVKDIHANGVFIPGNHDWANNRVDGFERIKEVTRYVDSIAGPQVEVLPKFGHPGPVSVQIGQFLHFIIMDSQWFLHSFQKDETTPIEVFKNQVKKMLQDSSLLHIFLSHHPLMSNGEHGGYFTWKEHVFPLTQFSKNLLIPLPIIGSLYPLVRQNGVSAQDISHSKYQTYIKMIESLISEANVKWIFSGHEHNIQVLKTNYTQVISGSSTSKKISQSFGADNTIFAHSGNGFAVLDIRSNNAIHLNVYVFHDNNPKLMFQEILKESSR